ncbi:MAG TPA: PLP-dependent aspartate aminotransferase family protein [Candidatus Cloacimonadota bacterium]|mgnify:CR=1 FL=1|nr:PLP-dependent aspartate aminotransferase family protein [Candidatus Cloacimonadota bacterium]HPT71630.1 PLP-dependent aspartate aminotransferase family protein [Candidatus Cloacimonadota bacterium]
MKKDSKFNTRLIHAGFKENDALAVVTPIYQTSTFAFKNAQHGADLFAGEGEGYIYTRLGNPTIRALEDAVANLEGGFGGIAVASGMAAVTTIYMGLLGTGSHIVSTDAVYGASRGALEKHFSRFGVEATFIDTSNIELVEPAFKPNTKVLFIETPANPTMAITDIAKCAEIAHKHGAKLVVDNTFCSPYLQNPLALGADVVFHSITKFINGHADVVGGVIVTKTEEDHKHLYNVMTTMGPNMDPHQAYLVSRGLKTLAVRMERAQENAMKIAEYLESHPKVAWVKYPGLKSHPQYELAKKQQKGPGAMISFGLKGGLEAGRTLMDNVHLAELAVSLGGIETLIQHPASMTHAKVSREAKLLAGITDELVRYSVGIEDVEDLIDDLEKALKLV